MIYGAASLLISLVNNVITLVQKLLTNGRDNAACMHLFISHTTGHAKEDKGCDEHSGPVKYSDEIH